LHSRRPSSPRRSGSAIALAAALATAARAESAGSPWSQTLDLAGGVGSSRFTAALSWNHFYGFFDQRLRVGLGARFASFFGSGAIPYTTADASLIRANKVNTLTVTDPQANSLNAQFLIRFRAVAGLELGFDIDLVGFAFGPSRTGSYAATDPRFAGPQPASVSGFDLLLGGKPDRGQLDSEFNLAYWLTVEWAVRAGLSHFASGYTTDAGLDNGADRYRASQNLAFIAVSWRLR
jgi:hypothetical protein